MTRNEGYPDKQATRILKTVNGADLGKQVDVLGCCSTRWGMKIAGRGCISKKPLRSQSPYRDESTGLPELTRRLSPLPSRFSKHSTERSRGRKWSPLVLE